MRLVLTTAIFAYLAVGLPMIASQAMAQGKVEVIDQDTLTQATKTASNTSQIMTSNGQILQTVNQTLQALTGNRTTGSLSSAALGSGFSIGGAPNLTSLLSGGQMSWGSLGQYGTMATTILNGLNLVKSLTGNTDSAGLTGSDKAYQGAVNTAAALTGIISGTQASSQARTQAFTAAAGTIGSAPDIKGSIDQNSQLQVQTGLTINELIGTMNANNAAVNAQLGQDLAGQAAAVRVMEYK